MASSKILIVAGGAIIFVILCVLYLCDFKDIKDLSNVALGMLNLLLVYIIFKRGDASNNNRLLGELKYAAYSKLLHEVPRSVDFESTEQIQKASEFFKSKSIRQGLLLNSKGSNENHSIALEEAQQALQLFLKYTSGKRPDKLKREYEEKVNKFLAVISDIVIDAKELKTKRKNKLARYLKNSLPILLHILL